MQWHPATPRGAIGTAVNCKFGWYKGTFGQEEEERGERIFWHLKHFAKFEISVQIKLRILSMFAHSNIWYFKIQTLLHSEVWCCVVVTLKKIKLKVLRKLCISTVYFLWFYISNYQHAIIFIKFKGILCFFFQPGPYIPIYFYLNEWWDFQLLLASYRNICKYCNPTTHLDKSRWKKQCIPFNWHV